MTDAQAPALASAALEAQLAWVDVHLVPMQAYMRTPACDDLSIGDRARLRRIESALIALRVVLCDAIEAARRRVGG